MSSIKQAAAVALQRRYREHLDRRAARILAEIDARVHEFRRLPTTRLDGAAATVGLHMSIVDLSAIIGTSSWPCRFGPARLLTAPRRSRPDRVDVAGSAIATRSNNAVCKDIWYATCYRGATADDHAGAGKRACAC